VYYARALCQRVNPSAFGREEETHEHKKHEHKSHERKTHEKHTHEKHHAARDSKPAKLSKSGDPKPKNPAPASHWDRQKIYTQDWLGAGADSSNQAPPVAVKYQVTEMLAPLGYVILAGLGISSFVIAHRAIESRA